MRDQGLEDNTLLIFLGDNGGTKEWADNSPFRGHKNQLFEGGIRVPFFVRWPRRLEENRVYEQPVISLDVFSTAIVAAGGTVPSDRPIDGVDLLPFLTGRESGSPHENLYWKFAQWLAVRRGDYKRCQWRRRTLLFDLVADPGEVTNIAAERPELVADLEASLRAWESGFHK